MTTNVCTTLSYTVILHAGLPMRGNDVALKPDEKLREVFIMLRV
ncbi:hypothetical protein [uncultured Mucilaginibacter sp.]|nr:hypothetical protein [uncultured Mucilaginibacter sp.]